MFIYITHPLYNCLYIVYSKAYIYAAHITQSRDSLDICMFSV